ncbi:unnamed protein product [Sphagnum troendelagicum]
MNNNLLTERALHGVFNTTSYITFGTTDDPLPYPHKDVLRSNFSGKQMQSHTPKLGFQTNDVFFQKEHPWVSDGDLYIDKNMYLTSQPERFKGFLSSDFSKTDEFSNVCRTEQYRSQLKMDNKFAKKSLSMMAKKMIEMAKTYPEIGKRTPTKVISSFCIYKLSVFVPTQQSNFYFALLLQL